MKGVLFSLLTFFITSGLLAETRAVVFDFGGVMTAEQNRTIVIDFLRESFHLSKDKFEKINKEKRVANSKGISDEEFWLSFAQKKRIQLPENWNESFKAVMKQGIGVNPHMYKLVEELKAAAIPVALLSNIDERLGKLLRDFGYYDAFYPCLLSYEIGLQKPDMRIYEYLLDTLDLQAEEVIFIDDKIINIEAARKLNIDGIVFESETQLREELAKRGLLVYQPTE
jgi:putative hydrolase of the HAD superfamily